MNKTEGFLSVEGGRVWYRSLGSGGIPLLPAPGPRTRLTLRSRRVYEKSGIVALEYNVGAGSS